MSGKATGEEANGDAMNADEMSDVDLEALIAEVATNDEERSELLEAHRQLEKDLLRLADPMPPSDFVGQVMKRVASAPMRVNAKAEVATAAVIVAAAAALALAALMATGGLATGPGIALASTAVTVRELLVAAGSAFLALWTTAALPTVVASTLVLCGSLLALKRYTQPEHSENVKVMS